MFPGMKCISKDMGPLKTAVSKNDEKSIRVERGTFIGRKDIIIKSNFYHKTNKKF